jgi:hypothetical protein
MSSRMGLVGGRPPQVPEPRRRTLSSRVAVCYDFHLVALGKAGAEARVVKATLEYLGLVAGALPQAMTSAVLKGNRLKARAQPLVQKALSDSGPRLKEVATVQAAPAPAGYL